MCMDTSVESSDVAEVLHFPSSLFYITCLCPKYNSFTCAYHICNFFLHFQIPYKLAYNDNSIIRQYALSLYIYHFIYGYLICNIIFV